MKLKLTWLLTLFMAFVMQLSFGQEKDITGTVTAASDGLPLPGVTVLVKGTTRGASTDFDGKYSIKANTGDILVFSFVSMKTTEMTVGSSSVIDLAMADDIAALDEIVITAQGITRSAKSLGYAVTTLKSDATEGRPETDIAKILTGKIAGVQVNLGGGFLGTGTNVIIRSKNSISGSNQPLYVIDGAPVSGDRSFDIDPNNIKTTTVLKGLAASTLYGQDGRNGVIIITTKTGSGGPELNKKFEATVSTTTTFLDVANLPDFQNTYGQGADNEINTTFVGNFGARFNGQVVPHHLSIPSLAASFPQFQGATQIYQAIEDNVDDFYSTGVGQITSIVLTKNFDKDSGVSASFGHTDQVGYLPENVLRRYNFAFGGRGKLSNNLSFNTSVTYNNTNDKRPTRDIFDRLNFLPRNLDIHNLPFQDPNDGSSVFYRTDLTNPLWSLENTGNETEADRIFVRATLDYKINDKINFSYTYSLDNTLELNTNHQNKGGVDSPLGFLTSFDRKRRVTTHRFSLVGNNFNLGENLSLNTVLGSEWKNDISDILGIASTDQVVFGFLRHNNFRAQSAIEGLSTLNTVGVYGQIDLAYKDYLFLQGSARNDWASTVESINRSVFYPSASLSFLPTAVFDGLKGKYNNNYLKLRAGYGTSANFPNAFNTRAQLNANANAFINPFTGGLVSTNSLSTFLPNPNIDAEELSEYEVGAEGRFLNGFLDFDISLYTRVVEDQILTSSLATSTGFSTTLINAGRIDTDGIEVSLGFNPIRNDGDGFNWNINNQFTAFETTVVDLPVDRVNISSGVNFAIEGEPFGVFRGTFAVRDDQGNLLINPSDGKIIASDDVGLEDKLIGDPNEDWRLTHINTFSYKGFTLGVQLEYIHGGDIFSVTASNLLRRGVTTDTEQGREEAFVIPGVLGDPSTGQPILDGNGETIRNTVQIGSNDLSFINLQDVSENIVYDASVFRIRDVSLSYSLPKSSLDKSPFGSVIFTVSGNNLFYDAPNIPSGLNLDPEVLGSGVGNGGGLDFQNDPSYKQYSFGVKLTF